MSVEELHTWFHFYMHEIFPSIVLFYVANCPNLNNYLEHLAHINSFKEILVFFIAFSINLKLIYNPDQERELYDFTYM